MHPRRRIPRRRPQHPRREASRPRIPRNPTPRSPRARAPPQVLAPAKEGEEEADDDPYEGIAPEELPPDLQYNADSSVSFPTNI